MVITCEEESMATTFHCEHCSKRLSDEDIHERVCNACLRRMLDELERRWRDEERDLIDEILAAAGLDVSGAGQ